jgi:hypothetical protein
MQQYRGKEQREPESLCASRLPEEVSDTDDADIEIVVLGVSPIDLLPSRCGEALNAIVACAQEKRAEQVDDEVKDGVDHLRLVAGAFIKHPTTLRVSFAIDIGKRSRPNRSSSVEEERE